ncbi:BCP1 family, partial [Dillenia turbinata]
KEMPRKPSRHRKLSKAQPLTFSPFARSYAQIASFYKAKQKIGDSNSKRKSLPSSPGNGFMKHTSKEKHRVSESSDEEESEALVQADFAFFDPKPDDFHGVKILLQTYLDNREWDLSGFVDLILGQTTVGTVVKVEGEEDDGLFALISALNLGRYKDHRCIRELKEYLLKVCQERTILDDLRLLLEEQAHNVGLLVSQRVVNLPPQLLPPLHDALFDEITWATEDEPTEELRKSFGFKVYLLISKVYKLKNANQKHGLSSDSEDPMIYIKPEDEIFLKLSLWCFNFPLHTQQVTAPEASSSSLSCHNDKLRNYQLMGLVMVVEADKVSTFRQQLQALITES